jgi:hypothetical protein
MHSLLGVDPTTKLVVDGRIVRLEQGSLAGFERTVTPLSQIASAGFGYKQPWKKAAIMAVIVGAILTFIPIIGWLIGLLVGLAYHSLNKELFIGYDNTGKGGGGIEFKRSVIEGHSIDKRAGERIVAIIEILLLRTEKPRALNVGAGAPGTTGETLNRAADELATVADRARQRTEAFAAQAQQMGERAAAKVSSSLRTPSATVFTEADHEAIKCPTCNAAVTFDNGFCGGCGSKLKQVLHGGGHEKTVLYAVRSPKRG